MTATAIVRPQVDEYAPHYRSYIARVPDGDLVAVLREQVTSTVTLLQDLSPERANYAYAPGKWTIKEVVGHIIDIERVFSYRALRIARNDPTELASVDENAYVANANFGRRTLADLLEELQVVRASTVLLAEHLDEEALAHRGRVSGNFVTVRALFYIIAGHERHHAALFQERYFVV